MEQKEQIKSSAELRRMARQQLKGNWGLAILLVFVYEAIVASCAIPRVGLIIYFAVSGALILGFNSCFLKIARGEKNKIENIFSGFKNFVSAFLLQLLIIIFTLLWALIAIVPFVATILIVVSKNTYYASCDTGTKAIVIAAFVGFFVLLIPAIIAQYRYSMSYYILSDCPDIGAYNAIKKSKTMMKGYKLKLFWLNLTFIGWYILGMIPLIGGVVFLIINMNKIDSIAGIVVWIIISYVILIADSLFVIPYAVTANANFYENLKDIVKIDLVKIDLDY
ncbi:MULTISPECIES: DUF975 family protein [Clostridium]|uniref:DUF975 family protein n=1 Tax=Clostridium TaxID=1485 RepID=UPI000824873D|nr:MULTISPECIES: DUF975 family protein [Clostridium]PJI09470.1 DUF975 domain-containing protein [Clostridium sp. CT7]